MDAFLAPGLNRITRAGFRGNTGAAQTQTMVTSMSGADAFEKDLFSWTCLLRPSKLFAAEDSLSRT